MCFPYGSFSYLVALSYSNLFIFDLSYCFLFDYYSLYGASFFFMRARKSVDMDGRGGGQELGGVRDKENHNQHIL